MAIHVLSFLVSLSLFTIALIAFHCGASIHEGQARERGERDGDDLKEVRAAIEKQQELYKQLQSMEIKNGDTTGE